MRKGWLFILGMIMSFKCNVYADHLFGINGDNVTRGTIAGARLDLSGIPSIADSTVTYTLGNGVVYLSTFSPIDSATSWVDKATITIVGVSAFVSKASSVGATMFQVYQTSSANYGVTWARISPQIVVTTNNRYSNYYSTSMVINQLESFGVGINTIALSGLPAEGWGVNFYIRVNRKNQEW